MTRVVVTGLGAVTPAGVGVDRLWEAARQGSSRVGRIDGFDTTGYRCRVAGQPPDFEPGQWLPAGLAEHTARFTQLALVAAAAALDTASLTLGDGGPPADRVGVTVGNVLGGVVPVERMPAGRRNGGPGGPAPAGGGGGLATEAQAQLCRRYGIRGRARTVSCDRASGAHAVVHGAELIRRGQADVVLAGGTEAPLSPYPWLCAQAGPVVTGPSDRDPPGAYRPFDRRHRGTALGEGSVFLVLERRDHARARGAPVHGELAGWALNTDGYLPYYSIEPYGETLARAVSAALAAAAVDPAALGAVVADGSAVPSEDSAEVRAITAALGGAGAVPVTAVKPVTGHLLGAGTVADVAVALAALRAGEVPPATNLESPAPGFDLDFVTGAPRAAPELAHVAVIARGLAGMNGCLVLSRPAGDP